MESADFFRQILFQPRLLRIRVRKTSPVKGKHVLGRELFGKLYAAHRQDITSKKVGH